VFNVQRMRGWCRLYQGVVIGPRSVTHSGQQAQRRFRSTMWSLPNHVPQSESLHADSARIHSIPEMYVNQRASIVIHKDQPSKQQLHLAFNENNNRLLLLSARSLYFHPTCDKRSLHCPSVSVSNSKVEKNQAKTSIRRAVRKS
jgi:hypothetical protein